jgi:hypothetical protein
LTRRRCLEADRLSLRERSDACMAEDEEPELRAAVRRCASSFRKTPAGLQEGPSERVAEVEEVTSLHWRLSTFPVRQVRILSGWETGCASSSRRGGCTRRARCTGIAKAARICGRRSASIRVHVRAAAPGARAAQARSSSSTILCVSGRCDECGHCGKHDHVFLMCHG